MEPTCCTEMKSTVIQHRWTIKGFSSTGTTGANMILRSSVFCGKSIHSSYEFSWYYELNPQKTRDGYCKVAIDAFTNCTSHPTLSHHASIVWEAQDGNNFTCFGALKAGTRIGDSMMHHRSTVNSHLGSSDTLILTFKLTLIEEVVTGSSAPEPEQPTLQVDAHVNKHYGNLLTYNKFSDVTFDIGEEQIFAHKAILTVRSPVFAAMFEHDMQETKENKVKITDIRAEVFREVLRFIYTGSVQAMEQMADDLLIAAEKYALDALKTMCEKHLAKKLSVETATATLHFADTYNANQLKKEAIDFISKHLKVMKSTDWASVIATNPEVAAEMIAQMAKVN